MTFGKSIFVNSWEAARAEPAPKKMCQDHTVELKANTIVFSHAQNVGIHHQLTHVEMFVDQSTYKGHSIRIYG